MARATGGTQFRDKGDAFGAAAKPSTVPRPPWMADPARLPRKPPPMPARTGHAPARKDDPGA